MSPFHFILSGDYFLIFPARLQAAKFWKAMDSHGEIRLPIVAEARGKLEDNMLEKAFYRIMTRGTGPFQQQSSKSSTAHWLSSEENNIVGMQIADPCAHPCPRHILNPSRTNRAFEIAERHIYKS